jgi:hypothetical protein
LGSKADEGAVREKQALTLKQTQRVGPDSAGLSEVDTFIRLKKLTKTTTKFGQDSRGAVDI